MIIPVQSWILRKRLAIGSPSTRHLGRNIGSSAKFWASTSITAPISVLCRVFVPKTFSD